MSFLRRGLERRGSIQGSWDASALSIQSWASSSGGGSKAGPAVTMDSALTLETVFRGVQLISDKLSGLDILGMERDADGVWTAMRDVPAAIADPFLGFRQDEGVSQLASSLVLRGNAYLVPVKDTFGRPRWRILDPDMVTVRWDDQGQRAYRINGHEWTGQMEHLTTFMLPGRVKGAGIVEYCRTCIGLGIALAESASTFFVNGSVTPGFISTQQPLDPDGARAFGDQWRQNHAGTRNAHLPAVLSGGAKWIPMQVTPEDAQFLQSRQFSAGQFATLLGIPPHLLGIVDRTTSWGSGIEVQSRNFVDYTLQAYIDPIQDFLTDLCATNVKAQFDIDALVRADTATRYQNYNVALISGFLSVNEIRAMERLKGIGALGDVYYAPQLSVPAQKALENSAANTPQPTGGTGGEPTSGDSDAGDQQ